MQKKEDRGSFTILCKIRLLHFAKALSDLGVSINISLYLQEDGFG